MEYETDMAIVLLFCFIAVYFLYDYLTYIMQATSNLKTFAWARSTYNFAYLVLIICFFLYLDEINSLHVIFAAILAQATGLIPGLRKIKKSWFFPVKFDQSTCRDIFIFSPLFFGSIMSFIVMYIDIIVIKKYMMITDVGVYSLAYKIMEITKQFILEMIPLLTPIIIGLYVANKDFAIKHYVKRIISQGLFGWCVLLTVASISCGIIPVLFGTEFSGAVLPLRILIVGLGFNGLASLTSGIIVTYKKIKPMVFINVGLALCNLVGDFILVPLVGIKGAAIATAVAFSFAGIGYLMLVMQITGVKRVSIFFLPLPLIIPVLCHIMKVNSFIGSIIVVLIYIIFLKVFRIFQPGDEKILDKVNMPSVVKKIFMKIFVCLSF